MRPRACRSSMKLIVGVAFACLVIGYVAAGVWAADSGGMYVPNEYIIHCAAGTSPAEVQALVAQMGASVESSLPLDDTYLIKLGYCPVDRGHSRFRRKT